MAGWMLFPPLVNLGFASLRLRDHARAAAAFAELLTIGQELSDAAAVDAPPPGPARVAAPCVGLALLGLAGVAAARGAARTPRGCWARRTPCWPRAATASTR